MTLLSTGFFVATIAYLTLAVLIVARNRRSSLNWVCAGVLLCLALWSFTDIFHNDVRLPVERIRFFANLGSLGWCSFPSLLFIYSLILTHRRRALRNWPVYPPLVALPAFFAYLQWTGHLGVDYTRQTFGWVTVWAGSAWPFMHYAYTLLSATGAVWVIVDYRRRSTSARERRQNLALIITVVVPIVFGAVTNAVLPKLTTIRFPELAGIFGLTWAGGLYYSATRYGLLAFSPYAAADEILATMVDSLILLAPDHRIVNANRATLDLLGYRKSELVGEPGESLFALPGSFRDAAREVAAGKAIRQRELTALTRSGREIPTSISARLMRDTNGQAIGSVWVLHDITELRKSEDESRRLTEGLAALNRLAVELTTAAPDLDIYCYLAEQLRIITGAIAVTTSEYDPDRREMRIRRLAVEGGLLARVNQLLGRSIASLRMPVTPEIYDRVVKGTVGSAGDLTETTFGAIPRPVGTAIQKMLGVETFTGLAFAYRGELLGTAVISSRTGHPLPAADVLRTFANIAAVAIRRKRLEDTLRENEELYRGVIERANDGIVIIQDGVVKYANRSLQEMWGNVEIALTGKEFSDFLDPDERPRIAELYQRRLAGEKVPSTYETMLRRHDGGQVYVELNAGVISYQGQPADLVIVRDTSERRQSAAALQYSEENFRTLAERANDAIFISDAQGRHVFANERATALTGYSVTELLTTRFRDLVRPEDISWLEARAAARLQGEQPPSQYEIIVRRKDGQEIPLELSVTRTYWRGAPATLVVARDIIERKRAEAELLALRDRLEEQVRARTAELTLVNRQLQEKVEEHRQVEERLRESEARFHGVFEKATTGMCLTGTDGRFLDVNQSLCQMLEYTHVELSATGFAAVTHPDDLPASRECVRSLLAGERETYRFEKRYLKKSRGVVWTDVSTILLRTPEGAPLYFITHIHDITERRQTEDRVRQLNRELEATVARLKTVNQELESFSYSVSHDLRAPLRSLDGFSQALLDDCRDRLDAQGQDYFNRVRAASQRMAQLIDDLLKLSRVTRSELHIESVNLTELARSVLLEIRQVEPDRTVAVTIAPGLQANGDARLLRILLINLLGNAWKFTSRRPGATIEFGILDNAPTPSPLTPVFYIRDNGAGFDMAYVGKLFAPFQRLHGAAEFPGSGIGLATAQRIVLRHGGRIWAKGTPGKGASFFFTLGEQPTPEASSNLHDRNPKRADSDLGFRT